MKTVHIMSYLKYTIRQPALVQIILIHFLSKYLLRFSVLDIMILLLVIMAFEPSTAITKLIERHQSPIHIIYALLSHGFAL